MLQRLQSAVIAAAVLRVLAGPAMLAALRHHQSYSLHRRCVCRAGKSWLEVTILLLVVYGFAAVQQDKRAAYDVEV